MGDYRVRRIEQANEVITSYEYPAPFAAHLKGFFLKNKQMGSRDRRELRDLLYDYFRKGSFDPQENDVREFPCKDQLSEVYRNQEFFDSYLRQSPIWIHVKPLKREQLLDELKRNQIDHNETEEPTVISLKKETDFDKLESFRSGIAWIQDKSTQKTSSFFKAKQGEIWWDACAGSGGKSLLFRELNSGVRLVASDIRTSILRNYRDRLERSFHESPATYELDLDKGIGLQNIPEVDGIILDVPCSGSGTWARTPEHLKYFECEQIERYARRQQRIIANAISKLKSGGRLIYITCSVYKTENEDVVEYARLKLPLQLKEQLYIEGYKSGGENIFVAEFIKE